jgi:hypothetical protein
LISKCLPSRGLVTRGALGTESVVVGRGVVLSGVVGAVTSSFALHAASSVNEGAAQAERPAFGAEWGTSPVA